jgi:hypothetical protein
MLRSLASGSSARSVAIQMNRSILAIQNRALKLKIVFSKRSSKSDHEAVAVGTVARLVPRDHGSEMRLRKRAKSNPASGLANERVAAHIP